MRRSGSCVRGTAFRSPRVHTHEFSSNIRVAYYTLKLPSSLDSLLTPLFGDCFRCPPPSLGGRTQVLACTILWWISGVPYQFQPRICITRVTGSTDRPSWIRFVCDYIYTLHVYM